MKTPPDKSTILSIVKSAKPLNTKGEPDRLGNHQVSDYYIKDGKMWLLLQGKDRSSGQTYDKPTLLTLNFSVLITEQKTLDDGLKTETVFVLEGKTDNGEPLPVVTINASKFPSLAWTWEKYGGRALLSPNQATPRLAY